MKKILLIGLILLAGCDYTDTTKIGGIKFTDTEIQTINERGIPVEYIQVRIEGLRANGATDEEIKESIMSIKSYGADIIKIIEEQSTKDKNRFYKHCHDQLAKNAKTFEENEFVTKYCSCMSGCLIENVKWSNNMPISLSEEDEKDMAKVDLAWIELEKNCKQECLKNN